MTRHQFEAEKLPPEIQQIADRMNIEPDRIPLYKLPELPFSDSVSADDFLGRIRSELVRIMAENIYGPIPPHCDELVFRPRSEGMAFDGLASAGRSISSAGTADRNRSSSCCFIFPQNVPARYLSSSVSTSGAITPAPRILT